MKCLFRFAVRPQGFHDLIDHLLRQYELPEDFLDHPNEILLLGIDARLAASLIAAAVVHVRYALALR
ncbi:hypothetical protein A2947_02315 [Candidatus Peribacteria bacterium RIFCSPLOWO2_01_FULL_54_110]|nr:MAG: hypothetical protein A2947_02315 [Candidatus Peribacteria bacterium RIFCSPLOWO2_01_FULL_54_110]